MEDMAKKQSNFTQRANGYWYYRARVPSDIQRFCKEREKWISLRTKNVDLAKARFHILAAQKLLEYDEIRKKYAAFRGLQLTSPQVSKAFAIDRDEAVSLAKAYMTDYLRSPDNNKTSLDWGEGSDNILYELHEDLANLTHPQDDEAGRFLVYNTAKYLLKRGGYEVSPAQSIDNDFLKLVRRTLISLRTIEIERMHGNFADDPKDQLLKDFSSFQNNNEKNRVDAVSVQQAIEKLWIDEFEDEGKATKTIIKYRASLNLISRFLGPETLIRDVTRQDLVSYRDTLLRMPSNYSKKFTNDRSFGEIIEEADKLNAPRMKYKTRETYISLMKRLFRWSANNDYIKKDISQNIQIKGKKTKGRNKRRPFTLEELDTIFSTPVFTGCQNDERGYAKPGDQIVKRSRYWLPLIALYTGMRMGEILQLRTSHVRKSPKGNFFFYLTDGFGEDDGDKDFLGIELKTFNSRREVPIHPVLTKLGFLKFVEEVEMAGQTELFPEVPTASDGKKSSIFSKRFARFLKNAGIKPDGNGNCFHMFRHTLRDAIRDCGISPEIADAVQGWARDDNEGGNYGLGFRTDAIAETWSQLTYEGFDYSHLTENETDKSFTVRTRSRAPRGP